MRVVLLLLLLACGCDSNDRVRLATTTSTQNSGLIELLRPNFEKSSGIDLEIIAVGTGQALELGRRGDVDIVLVHARELEDTFLREGHGVDRRDIMWNDFVIVGPAKDPAGIRGSNDGSAALAKIAARDATFVSRGDGSGTHVRELSLWKRTSAGAPPKSPSYKQSGQGMGNSLLVANEKQAYVLTDRGTWLAYRDRLRLELLVEGGSELLNPYGAILVNPENHDGIRNEQARALLEFLVSAEAQAIIADFRVQGEVLFHPAVGDG